MRPHQTYLEGMQMIRLFLVLIACALMAGHADAAESAASVTKRATVSLVSDTDAVSAGTPYRLGLRMRMAPGWHSYGRNPGDAGIPPELEWTLPAGTSTGEIAWPTPKRQPEGDLMTFAYTGEVLLAVPATGPGPVRLHASWLVCDNICVPEEAEFSLDLPLGTPAPSAQAGLFAAAEAALPRPSPFQARITPAAQLRVTGAGRSGEAVREAWFIPDTPNLIAPGGAQTLRAEPDGITLAMTPAEGFKPDMPLSGVLVLRDRAGLQTDLAVTATPGPPLATTSLWRALGFAMLGGLILNLMPCVFPVLAMKAFAIAKLAGGQRGTARALAGAYTLGVLATFATIGLGLVALRSFGHAVGWGFQFQSPVFVAGMAWLLFATGLNMSGLFEIQTGLEGAGQTLTLRRGLPGSFASGALAVLVATPCTAPFMGVAIAAALAAPPGETLAVFLAMGLGLAAPTALLSVLPGIGRLLPRPGAWMAVFRQALAFPMYAAVVWLVWVISLQSGPPGVLATASGLVLIGFAAWAWRLRGRVARGLAVASVAAALALLPMIGTEAAPAAEKSAESFTPARLADLRAAGRPVFINMTAAWCVTCLVNERVALGTEAVRAAFAAGGVTLLKGDWTRQDPQISAFLQAQGRDGVPLYVFFPAGGRAPVVLPQLLTEAGVLAVIKG
jgi:thiol:disulfide interchange protein DsbD